MAIAPALRAASTSLSRSPTTTHSCAGHAERSRGVEDQCRLGLAAVAIVLRRVRTDEKPRERSEQFVDAPVDRIDLLHRDESAPHAALIAHHRQLQTGRAQPVEQRARAGQHFDLFRIAVERNVDDQRLVAIEEHGANVHALRLRTLGAPLRMTRAPGPGRKLRHRRPGTRAISRPCRARRTRALLA